VATIEFEPRFVNLLTVILFLGQNLPEQVALPRVPHTDHANSIPLSISAPCHRHHVKATISISMDIHIAKPPVLAKIAQSNQLLASRSMIFQFATMDPHLH
jgi:hypothetical protein